MTNTDNIANKSKKKGASYRSLVEEALGYLTKEAHHLYHDNDKKDLKGIEIFLGVPLKKPLPDRSALEDINRRKHWGASWYPEQQALFRNTAGDILDRCLRQHNKFIRKRFDDNSLHIYNSTKGSWFPVSQEMAIKSLISWLSSTHLRGLGTWANWSHAISRGILNMWGREEEGPFPRSREYIAYRNGILSLKTLRLSKFNHSYPTLGRVEADWKSHSERPVFDKFLNDITEGHDDRKKLVRAILWAILHNRWDLQVFFYLQGTAGSGKSTLSKLAQALLPQEMVQTASLNQINHDTFGVANLKDAALVVVPDVNYQDVGFSNLKNLTGGDSVSGSQKFVQSWVKIEPTMVFLITGNFPLRVDNDMGNPIKRRLVSLPIDNRVEEKDRKRLIEYSNGFKGPLWDEISAITRWVAELKESEAVSLLKSKEPCPSLSSFYKNQYTESNIGDWVRSNLVYKQGSYVLWGVKSQNPYDHLYPNYFKWTLDRGERPWSVKAWASSTLSQFKSLEWKDVNRTRKKQGMAFENIAFIEEEPHTGIKAVLGKEDNPLLVDILDSYIAHLNNSWERPMRKKLDQAAAQWAKEVLKGPDKERIFSQISGGWKGIESDLLKTSWGKKKWNSYLRALNVIADGNFSSNLYRPGVSTCRLHPEKGTPNFSSFKKDIKKVLINEVNGFVARSEGLQIVDLDLTNCFVSLIFSFWPGICKNLRGMMEGSTMWEYIESWLAEQGNGHLFYKPWVKIAVYSSFFGGGENAMVTGILEATRETNHMTATEFEGSDLQRLTRDKAIVLCRLLMRSPVILGLKEISQNINSDLQHNLGRDFTGPFGRTVSLERCVWSTNYSLILQELELALVAGSVMRSRRTNEFEVCLHSHDGVLVVLRDSSDCIERDPLSSLLNSMKENAKVTARDLGALNTSRINWEEA